MDRLDLSDAYLETLSDSDVVRTSNEIGMTVPRRGEPRQDTLRRIRTLRDRSMRTTKSSERELERVCYTTSGRCTASIDII